MSTVATQSCVVHPERWIDETDASDPAPTFSATGFADEDPGEPFYTATPEDLMEADMHFCTEAFQKLIEAAADKVASACPGVQAQIGYVYNAARGFSGRDGDKPERAWVGTIIFTRAIGVYQTAQVNSDNLADLVTECVEAWNRLSSERGAA